ncbi:arrestin domain-containing protein 3-like [Rhopalosiphum maidis]|uniref:arrestin domain-containing protein 3-like n=1 Tax=Rhopalosiphum maidis TaxID=43146 RepID=UPI000EFF13CD|nr:arrestin domain-containing protein 3-like [Rhopalosiphum maidis]XP_026817897.1 arrestin domain-containing protein 3-like [Rhopalosiphum maidis]XP_028044500.1 arrestin domain-containing protein 3-like [Rhopalosiphum maidis]
MGMQDIQIIFDDPTAVFKPGQTITGRVLIQTSSSVKIKSIKLKFRGEANVRWTETRSRKNKDGESENHLVSYSAREEYFKNKIFLVGAKGESQLEVGEYVYPFNFSLPHQLPSTFNGKYGKICYIVKVKINIPWKKNIEKEIMFEIISPINLNDDPSLAEPKKKLKEKFYCCCCCKSGPMTLIACIPYSGFVPGQSIPVTVELDNNSNMDVDTIKIKLDRTLKFIAPRNEIKSELFKIVNVYIDGVEKHTSKTRVVQLQIPNGLVIPNLKHCGIMSDTYILNVEACVKGTHLNEVASLQIILGNTPLTIANNAHQFDSSFQPLNQYYFPNEPISTNLFPSVGFNDSTLIPGYAQLEVPNNQPCTVPQLASQNLENSMILTQNNLLNIQLAGFPDPPPPYQFAVTENTSEIPTTFIKKN